MTVPSTTVLNRLAFGPRPGEGAEVERLHPEVAPLADLSRTATG